MGLFVGRELEDGYEPSILHKLLKPKKISGNTINGLGETEDRPATPVYHRFHLNPFLPIQIHFNGRQIWDTILMNSILQSAKIDKMESRIEQPPGPSNIRSAEENTRSLKALALSSPKCDVVRIAENHPNLYFDRELETEKNLPKYCVVLAVRMNYETMSKTLEEQDWASKPPWKQKWADVSREVLSKYLDVHEAAHELANWIRSEGYPAEALGGPPSCKINMLRAAVEAGVGELGKHGSILNDEYGSNLRLAVVLTDMPVEVDGPREFGADEFCLNCQLCTTACPPKAISDEKQMVRGFERWYVDFDKCVPYFNDTRGCGICITVCPWSRPGVAPNLTQKMLKKRKEKLAQKEKVLGDS